MELLDLPPVVARYKTSLSPLVCDPTTAEHVVQVPFRTVYNGEEHMVTDPGAPHKGNFIDATPYSYTLRSLQNYPWTAEVQYRRGVDQPGWPCGYWSDMTVKFDGRGLWQLFPNSASSSPSFSTKEMEAVKGMADTKAKAKLRAGLMNLPLLFAERVQTLNTLKERVGDMIRVATSIQKRDLATWRKLRSAKSKRAFAQKAASSHLEVIFGWLPVIDEIEGAIEFLEETEWTTLYGSGRHLMLKTNPLVTQNYNSSSYGYWSMKQENRSTYSVRTKLRADIETQLLGQAQRLGFNPIYTLYDLTPLSFISGWFSNFNHYVQSVDPLYGANFRTGSRSVRTRNSSELHVYPNSTKTGPYDWMACRGQGNSILNVDYVRREILTSEPESNFEFYNNFSTYSALASMSLYLQRRLKPLHKALKVKQFRYRPKKTPTLPPIRYTNIR